VIETLVPPLQRWLLFSGVLVVAGAVAWRGVIAPRVRFRLSGERVDLETEPPELVAIEKRICWTAGVVSAGLVGVWGMRLWAQLLEFRDPFAPLMEDLEFLVLQTFWGTVWMAQGVILVGLAAGFFLLRYRAGTTPPPPPGTTLEGVPRSEPRWLEFPLRWKVVVSGVFLLLLTLGLSSHAMSVPGNRALAVSVDMTHTAAAGFWMGALFLILSATPGRNAPRGQESQFQLLGIQLQAFSPLAMVSVGVLLFMGILLSTFHVPDIPALWESQYGRRLSLKVLVAFGVLALGFWNWRRGLPSLAVAPTDGGKVGPGYTTAAERRIRRSAAVEVLLAVIVLLITAILVATPVPPGAH